MTARGGGWRVVPECGWDSPSEVLRPRVVEERRGTVPQVPGLPASHCAVVLPEAGPLPRPGRMRMGRSHSNHLSDVAGVACQRCLGGSSVSCLRWVDHLWRDGRDLRSGSGSESAGAGRGPWEVAETSLRCGPVMIAGETVDQGRGYPGAHGLSAMGSALDTHSDAAGIQGELAMRSRRR